MTLSDFWTQLAAQWQAQSILEVIAVGCALLYLILAAGQNIWCWLMAAISTAIYIFLFHDVALYSESLLNIFYLAMAGYGWYQWRYGGSAPDQLPVTMLSVQSHLIIIVATALAVPALGYWMQKLGADYAYLDAFTSCYAVVATWMVTRKILENWYYWFVIDSVSIYLYWQKAFYLTAALFAVYLVLIVIGYLAWRKTLIQQSRALTAA